MPHSRDCLLLPYYCPGLYNASFDICREKDTETSNFLEEAKKCIEVCHSHGLPMLINDRIDIVLTCDADGVHVGQPDMPAHVARSLLRPKKIIGMSCKTPEQANQTWVIWVTT